MENCTRNDGENESACCSTITPVPRTYHGSDEAPFMTIDRIPIYFSEDWNTGIGGGLWSTGLAMAKYFQHYSRSVRNNLTGLAVHKQRCQKKSMLKAHQNGEIDSDGGSEPPLSSEPCSPGLSVLELGSGNGFLSLAFLAASMEVLEEETSDRQQVPFWVDEMVVTDMADHLSLMSKTSKANSHLMRSLTTVVEETKVDTGDNGKEVTGAVGFKSTEEHFDSERGVHGCVPSTSTSLRKKSKMASVTVIEHRWGEWENDNGNSAREECCKDDGKSSASRLRKEMQIGTKKFDFIFGSDVAYRDYLHAPLIDTLVKFSHERTVSLIGVTMNDTKPVFFDLLHEAGFRYERLADHLIEPEFRGKVFGLFLIQRL